MSEAARTPGSGVARPPSGSCGCSSRASSATTAPRAALASYAARTGADVSPDAAAEPDLVQHVETLLAGAVGSASARFIVGSVVEEEPLAVDEVLQILDETSQVLAVQPGA